MDEELKQLEAELAQLRPLAPSVAMKARIARQLSAGATVAARPAAAPRAARAKSNVISLPWLWNAALPAAAAIAIFASAPNRDASPAPETLTTKDSLRPVTAEKVLYATQDEGLVTLDDGTSARRERLSFVDTVTWRDPRTNASLTWRVPREEVRVVPVNFQ